MTLDRRFLTWTIDEFYELLHLDRSQSVVETYGYFDMISNEYVLVVEVEPA